VRAGRAGALLAAALLSASLAGAAAETGEHEAHGDAAINWAHGFVGEKDGVEPGLLWRPRGMPAPYLAQVANTVVLFGILILVGRAPLAEALRRRRERIVAGMEEAAKMRSEAEVSLAGLEDKLRHLDEEIERVRREMREGAEVERRRLMTESRERRERLERDARVLVEQELKAAREVLVRETVVSAVRSAEEILAKRIGAADHERVADDYLEAVRRAPLERRGEAS
jgi:F0F1-type ATP synthase membrane subunit b/b'